jgi:hypothetical protein
LPKALRVRGFEDVFSETGQITVRVLFELFVTFGPKNVVPVASAWVTLLTILHAAPGTPTWPAERGLLRNVPPIIPSRIAKTNFVLI